MKEQIRTSYAPADDTTFIMRDRYDMCDNLVSTEVVGFYSGEPDEQNTVQYIGDLKAVYEADDSYANELFEKALADKLKGETVDYIVMVVGGEHDGEIILRSFHKDIATSYAMRHEADFTDDDFLGIAVFDGSRKMIWHS